MKKTILLIIAAAWLIGCDPGEVVKPPVQKCAHSVSITGNKAFLQINSQSEYVTVCRDYGRCFDYHHDYFNCISLSVNPHEVIEVIDNGIVCEINIP